MPMKLLFYFISLVLISNFFRVEKNDTIDFPNELKKESTLFDEKDTCIIEGLAFRMYDSKSKRIMRAYIKNGQIYVVNDGLQFAKYRIIQYVFYSLSDEQMPSFRWYNQRLSPPIIQILKNASVGQQFVFEEIVIVDQQSNILSNQVRALMIERVKD
jgi:hypothetical protein